MQKESLSQRISRELRWLREQDDCLTLEYIASCSGAPAFNGASRNSGKCSTPAVARRRSWLEFIKD